MRKRLKQQPIASATHLRANVVTVRSWRTCLRGWITHPFSLSDSCIGNTTYFGVVQHLLISIIDIDMSCVLQGNKRGCDFNQLVYGPRSHCPNDLELLMSLDSDDLPCPYAPQPLCQCGVQARQGVVPSKFRYGYFCGNVVGEDDACVSS
jgi:hypothetical protein